MNVDVVLLVAATVLSIFSAVLVSRANPGKRLPVWVLRAKDARIPLSTWLTYFGALSLLVSASARLAASTSGGGRVATVLAVAVVLLVFPQLVGRALHNRHLPQAPNGQRAGD